MAKDIKGFNVFIASPSGLDKEREVFRKCLQEFNSIEGIRKNIIFNPDGWERTLGGIGRPQSIINQQVIESDFFVVVLHNKWGSHPGNNRFNATSGSEEEYLLALECFHDLDKPMKQVVVVFKSLSLNEQENPDEEIKKVLNFRQSIEKGKNLLYHTFSNIQDFEKIIREHLIDWSSNPNQKIQLNESTETTSDLIYYLDLIEKDSLSISKEEIRKVEKGWEYYNNGNLTKAELVFSSLQFKNYNIITSLNHSKFLRRLKRDTESLNLLNEAEIVASQLEADFSLVIIYNLKGKYYYEQRDYLEGIKYFTLSIKLSTLRDFSFEMAYGHKMLGIVQYSSNQFKLGLESLEKAISINSQNNFTYELAKCHEWTGTILAAQCKFQKAADSYIEASSSYKELNKLQDYSNSKLKAARNLIYVGKLDEAWTITDNSLEIDSLDEESENLLISLSNFGRICLLNSDYKTAFEYFSKAVTRAKGLNNDKIIASALLDLAQYHFQIQDYDNCRKNNEEALKLYSKSQDKKGLAAVFGNFGNIDVTNNDFDSAIKNLSKSLEYYSEINNDLGLANQTGNIGVLFIKMGKYIEAENMLKQSIHLNSYIDNLSGLANAHGNLASLFLDKGDYEKAETEIQKSIEIETSLGNISGAIGDFILLSDIKAKSLNFIESNKILNKALQLAKNSGLVFWEEKVSNKMRKRNLEIP
ncbi:tetratricopeptide repeat protein [Jiulongibacter sediminis]|uniref:Uncharacterized protein n=1 Tax=Jiulongibacter sediminis TaxID=1605367 RepID=A0A0P7BP36_9BACT|nr:tetratricopeptide repeat protein [Jiulongibacter sediminis]KPM47046.1 hypothetical protein AFM12_17640 [Jiulongibacter sediminis]TBX22389.1 hypothetical protein TK44_17645 [Jiulongibacter sediminis]